jgi:hypothetical protein
MPIGNNFQHATYSRSDPGGRLEYRDFAPGAPPHSVAWQEAVTRLGGRLSKAGVRAMVCMHGTVMSSDVFGVQRLDDAGGLKRGYSRGIPGIDALLALMRDGSSGIPLLPKDTKPPIQDNDQMRNLLDQQAGDAGNFSAAFLKLVSEIFHNLAPHPIQCSRYIWSSEHHHLGRAEAAWRLLDRLIALSLEMKLGPGDRILIQAHGQAGLVCALLSNLLALAEETGRKTFLDVLESYYQHSTVGADVVKALFDLRQRLCTGTVLNGVALDIVTHGTPVRYGWDPSGIGSLLHFVNHRPMRTDGKRWLAKMELPQITMEMPLAWGGDYVQQLAVAGTDAVPTSPEAQAANKALWDLLEPFDGFERWLECARKSVRCQNDGHCLLVDYKDTASQDPRDHYYGHAAYTRHHAILFNMTEIAERCYPNT